MKGSEFYGTTCMCNSDSPVKRNGEKSKTVVSENTSEIKKDKKNKDYTLIMNDSKNFAAGDTIRPGNAPIVDGKYIMGGDYKTKKIGKKNYKIIGDA